ncbi:MAG: helix-hairpin-helix domain-containing protein [Thermoleophilia bacterium]|nr:helix-hairpin-helix domain-containing protein [Thermoleophilia bacterium]
MSSLPKGQLFVYALIAVVLLLVGASSLRDQAGSGSPGSVESASAAGGEVQAPGNGAARDGLSGEGEPGTFAISASSDKLVVDVSGAVEHPGVYRFSDGERVVDAIRRAGGPARGALAGAINRAARLADGQQVVVPFRAGTGGGAGPAAVAAVAGAGSGPISFGGATTEELEEIEGIGPVTAADLIEFRESRGGIASIDELDQVSGIGPVTMEALRSRLQP